jgi:hypothetical protein
MRLSIQQSIFKTVADRVKQCNEIWAGEASEAGPHYAVISELIISNEVIERSLSLFKIKKIEKNKDDFYYLFWKQLRPDLRGFIRDALTINSTINNLFYTKQIEDLHKIFEKFFESRSVET